MVGLRQTAQLETYAGSAIPVPLGVAGPAELRVPYLVDVDGAVELSEADLPLVVRSARGFGETTFLATDLDEPPLTAWKGRGMLIRRLLDQPAALADEESGRSRPLMHYGFVDAAGQLRRSLDRFDGVRPTPFWLVVTLLSAYVVLIGPLDYYLVRRVMKRMVLTWVTFPLIIAAVASRLPIFWLGISREGRCAIRWTWSTLMPHPISPAAPVGPNCSAPGPTPTISRPGRFRLAQAIDRRSRPDRNFAPGDPHLLLSWFGLAGSGLGGMTADPQSGALD